MPWSGPGFACLIGKTTAQYCSVGSVVSRKYTREVNHLQGLKPVSFQWLYVRAEALTPVKNSRFLVVRRGGLLGMTSRRVFQQALLKGNARNLRDATLQVIS
jgi:hypothetical protein